jgi:hypothetical protein
MLKSEFAHPARPGVSRRSLVTAMAAGAAINTNAQLSLKKGIFGINSVPTVYRREERLEPA